MSALTPSEERFVAKRKAMLRPFFFVMVLCAVAVVGFWVYEIFATPLLADPFHVLERLEEDSLDETTLVTMAAFCPLLFSLVMVMALALMAFAAGFARREMKYLTLMDRLRN